MSISYNPLQRKAANRVGASLPLPDAAAAPCIPSAFPSGTILPPMPWEELQVYLQFNPRLSALLDRCLFLEAEAIELRKRIEEVLS